MLVVEDEEMVRNSIAEALRREGFRVHTSASSREAWEIASREHPSLVITDVMMADMKGTELIAHLKKQNPAIKSILMSGYSDEEQVERAMQLHGSLFIPKPFTMRELVESALRLCKSAQ